MRLLGGLARLEGRDTPQKYEVIALRDTVADLKITAGATGVIPGPVTAGDSGTRGFISCVIVNNPDTVNHSFELSDARGVVCRGTVSSTSIPGGKGTEVFPGLDREIVGPLVLKQQDANGAKALNYSLGVLCLGRLEGEVDSVFGTPSPLVTEDASGILMFEAGAGFANWTVAAAATEWRGAAAHRLKADLSNVSAVRLFGLLNSVPSGTELDYVQVQYSADLALWRELCTCDEPGIRSGTPPVYFAPWPYGSGWVSIPGGARDDVYLRVVAYGDGATAIPFGPVGLQTR